MSNDTSTTNAPRTTPWWSTPLVLFVLLAAALAVYGDLLWRGPALTGYSDIIAQHLGTKQVLYRSLQSGHGIPFWRDDELSGAPGLTNPQSLYTYPLHFLFYFMPPERALGPTLWLHFLATGLAFYVLAATIGLSQGARLVMALAGMFNYKLIAITYSGWLPQISSLVFVPLLLAAVLFAMRSPGWQAVLAVALSGAACLHTGHLQLFYYAVLFLTLYAIVQSLLHWREGNRRCAAQLWLCLMGGALLATGAAAYLLAPMLGEASMISRSQATYDSFLADHALQLRQLASLFSPSAVDDGGEFWEESAYFGILPLLLALVGVVLGRKSATTWYLATGFLLSLLFSLDTPLLRVAFHTVPGFSLFRSPARFLFLTSIFGIGLAGIGAHEILVRFIEKSRNAALAAVGIYAVLMTLGAHGHAFRLLGVTPWFESSSPPTGIAPLPPTRYAEFLAEDKSTFRVATIMRPTVNYGWAASMNLQLISGYDPYNYRHYQTYMDLLRSGRSLRGGSRVWTDVDSVARLDMLDNLNVRYVLTIIRSNHLPSHWQEVAQFHQETAFVFYEGLVKGDIFLYRNLTARPRAWWANHVTGAASEKDMITAVAINNLLETTVVLGASDAEIQAAPEDSVQIVAQRDGHLEADLMTLHPRFLVLSEVWHPGWQARIDDEPVELVRANIALMGIWVPPGKSRLVLEFRPLYWRSACTVSILAGCILAGLMFHIFFLRRKHTNVATPR